MNNTRKSYIFTLLAVLFWSTIASAFKITLRYIDFRELLLFASATSVIILLVALAGQKKIHLLKQLKAGDYLRSAILGFINPFLYYLVLLKAYELLLAQEAGALNYIWPVVLVLLSIPLLRQKIGWISIAAVIVSFFGTMVIGTQGDIFGLSFSNPLGVGLALGSAILWALYWIYNIKDKKDEIVKLFLNFAFGTLYIFLSLIITGQITTPNTYGLLGSVYVGIFELGLTYILWMKGLQLATTTAKVSNLVFISPFISLFFIRFLVGEPILLSTIAGLTLIVGGILLQQYAGKFEKE
ncbi:MAG: EamA family transporter [Bacteroidetes bacterium 4484_276]|nr:MAG: EamA family transporter [Bacteroidetes bacterium 4484_276]